MDLDRKIVVFTDEKKFNSSGLDSSTYYWHDLRRKPEEVDWGLEREKDRLYGAQFPTRKQLVLMVLLGLRIVNTILQCSIKA